LGSTFVKYCLILLSITGLWFFWGKGVAAAISYINRPEVTAEEEARRALACTNINLTALAIIGLILAGATAGRYSFKYVKSDDKEFRFIGHLTTFILTFVIGILLVESAEIFGRSLGYHHWEVRGILSMSYIAAVFTIFGTSSEMRVQQPVPAEMPAGALAAARAKLKEAEEAAATAVTSVATAKTAAPEALELLPDH